MRPGTTWRRRMQWPSAEIAGQPVSAEVAGDKSGEDLSEAPPHGAETTLSRGRMVDVKT